MKLVFLGVALLCGVASAKPATVHVDAEIKRAWLIAEVRVLAVEKGDFMGRPRRGNVRVRVTNNPDLVFCGPAQAGLTLDLTPTALGPARCAHDLSRHVGKDPVLVVVDAKRAITITGTRAKGGYSIQSYCDYNACWLRCDDATLARRTRRSNATLFEAGLRKRFGAEVSAFWARAAPVLLDLPGPLEKGELERLLADLTGDAHELSQRAHRRLCECGVHYLDELRHARKQSRDPDDRRRLDAVLRKLTSGAEATAAAARLPIEKRRIAVRLALPALEGRERDKARKLLGY